MWYHNQCLSPGNMSYGTMISAFHMAMYHTVSQPVPCTWQCVIRYHNQCNMTMRHTVPRPVQHDNATYGSTTSVFHLAMCHTVPRPVPFTWHKGWKFDFSSDEVYFFSDLGTLCDFLRIQLLKDDIKLFIFLNQKTEMAICTKRENANRRHFYQVVSV